MGTRWHHITVLGLPQWVLSLEHDSKEISILAKWTQLEVNFFKFCPLNLKCSLLLGSQLGPSSWRLERSFGTCGLASRGEPPQMPASFPCLLACPMSKASATCPCYRELHWTQPQRWVIPWKPGAKRTIPPLAFLVFFSRWDRYRKLEPEAGHQYGRQPDIMVLRPSKLACGKKVRRWEGSKLWAS